MLARQSCVQASGYPSTIRAKVRFPPFSEVSNVRSRAKDCAERASRNLRIGTNHQPQGTVA